MKHFQISFTDDSEFLESLGEIREWCSRNPSFQKIFRIYSGDMDLDHIRHVCDILDAEMPDAMYLGCTSNANIIDGRLAGEGIILSCTVFERESTRAALLQLPFVEDKVKEDVALLREFCEKNPWVSAVEMHATIMDMSMKEFCDEMTKLPEHIQVFGGGAFNPDMDDDRAAVFSKGNGFLEHGIVFLLLGGSDFHAHAMFISGWKPINRTFRVTKANRERLYELDGEPALGIYQRFLNIQKNDKFFSNTLEFPLFVEHDDVDILRCPLAVNEDDSLVMSSDIQEGTLVRLAYGDPDTILASIRRDGQQIADFKPDVIQTFSCAARKAFWGDDNVSDETAMFCKIAPASGFYTHGEFLRFNGDMLNFNVTLVLAAMREGDPKPGAPVSIYDEKMDHFEKVPLSLRFVSFIEASTAELEEINKKLEIASITDGLTKLYNRAEIERRIRHTMEKRKRDGKRYDFSLIMLDIDNFKKVNDKYGHKEGDRVIQALADVLRDTVGMAGSSHIGRWGGEEFMVLLKSRTVEEAHGIAEDIRRNFAAVSYEVASSQTVSIGVTGARDGERVDSIYNRVDKALYMAKANGKNQVVRLD